MGIGLLATTLSATAQTTPNPATRPGTQSSPQGGIGGPPVGQQQQQELQQRQQQIQQSMPPPLPAGPPSPVPAGGGQLGGAGGQGMPSPMPGGGTGTVGEPSGTTTPQAQFGGSPGAGGLLGAGQATGAARTLAVAPATLSLPEAIGIGIDNNLTTLLATERATEARALRQQVRSFLLPNLFGTAYQQNRTLNLVAQGLVPSGGQDMSGGMAPLIPSFVGPFNTFDARLNFSQALLNLSALRQYKSTQAAVQVA
ncbi:MAG: hypothetical protein EOO62_16555, partial [Hymenobacter sp.]